MGVLFLTGRREAGGFIERHRRSQSAGAVCTAAFDREMVGEPDADVGAERHGGLLFGVDGERRAVGCAPDSGDVVRGQVRADVWRHHDSARELCRGESRNSGDRTSEAR
jgi:hypothetical protein